MLNVKGARKALSSFSSMEGAKAVLLQGKVYMGRATQTVLTYDRVLRKWDSLPETPVEKYAIASYQGQLVIVGGSTTAGSVHVSGQVYCYKDGEWSDRVIPAMNVPRENAIAVGFENYLIVLGGVTFKAGIFTNILKSTEIYWDKSKKWYMGPDLPRQGFLMQCVSADRYIFLLHPDGWTIRYCSLDQLVRVAMMGDSPKGLWHSLEKSVPYTRCSLVVYDNTLLTLAGAGSNGHVYAYNPKETKWVRVHCTDSTLPAIKNSCCLRVGQQELFVCGGDIDMMNQTSQAGYLLTVEESTMNDGEHRAEQTVTVSTEHRSSE